MGMLVTIIVVWAALIGVTLVIALAALRAGRRADEHNELDLELLLAERMTEQPVIEPAAPAKVPAGRFSRR